MIQEFVTAIQEAQVEIDRNSVACLVEMADRGQGIEIANQRYSLLELGLAPSFLHFRQSEMEARVSIDIRSSPPKTEKSAEAPDPSRMADSLTGASATPVDSAVASKYSYPPADSSSIRFRLVSVPAPAALQDRLAKHRSDQS